MKMQECEESKGPRLKNVTVILEVRHDSNPHANGLATPPVILLRLYLRDHHSSPWSKDEETKGTRKVTK